MAFFIVPCGIKSLDGMCDIMVRAEDASKSTVL